MTSEKQEREIQQQLRLVCSALERTKVLQQRHTELCLQRNQSPDDLHKLKQALQAQALNQVGYNQKLDTLVALMEGRALTPEQTASLALFACHGVS